MFFGRNLDWGFDYGETPIVVPRNYTWHSTHDGDQTTKTAITGMGIVQNGMPLFFDCANEDGLGVAGLSFAGYASYAEHPVDGKHNIPTFEFPLWITTNFTTVDQAEIALKDTVLTNDPAGPNLPVSPMHWLIVDHDRAIVVEQTVDGMKLFHDDFDALTNQPGFDFQRENLRAYLAATNEWPSDATWSRGTLKPYGTGLSMRQIPGDCSSPSRLVRAAFLNAFYPTQDSVAGNVSRLFHILGNVAMVLGQCKMADGSFEHTLYTGGWYSKTKTYYWNTYDNETIRYVTLTDELANAKTFTQIKEGTLYNG
jgi:choloylglycine hydrolase